MNDIQAAIAVEQMKKLDRLTENRIRNAKLLSHGLKGVESIITPFVKDNCRLA